MEYALLVFICTVSPQPAGKAAMACDFRESAPVSGMACAALRQRALTMAPRDPRVFVSAACVAKGAPA